MKKEWNILLPHVLDYNYTAGHLNLDLVAERIKEQYFNETIDEKNGIVNVSICVKKLTLQMLYSYRFKFSKIHLEECKIIDFYF